MFDADKGKLVLILNDCREGAPATGKYAICEGDLPVAIAYKGLGKGWNEALYSEVAIKQLQSCGFVEAGDLFVQAATELGYTMPMRGDGAEEVKAFDRIHKRSEELKQSTSIYYIRTNPRMRLEDGSHIWGYECWWKPIKTKMPQEDVAIALEKSRGEINQFMKVFAELVSAERLPDFEYKLELAKSVKQKNQ